MVLRSVHSQLLSLARSLGRGQKIAILVFLDGALAPLALWLALVTQESSLVGPAALQGFWLFAPVLSLAAAGMALALGIPRARLKSYDATGLARTALHGAALAGLGAALARGTGLPLSAGLWGVFALLFVTLAAGLRLGMLWALEALYRCEAPVTRVLIYGAGTTGMQLVSALKRHATIRPVAFVDDNPGLQGLTVAGLPVYRPARLAEIVPRQRISRVVLAMPSLPRARQAGIARAMQPLGVEVQAVPSFAQMIGTERPAHDLQPVVPGAFLGRAPVYDALEGLAPVYGGRAVLVTGAGGSIGAELCRQILSLRPARLVLLDHAEYALYAIERELRPLAEEAGIILVAVLGSAGQAGLLRRLFAVQRIDIVLHAAAYKHVPLVEANALAGLANNVLATEVLARAARAAGVQRFVMISSDKAVRPTNIMGASKRLAEIVIQDLAARSGGGKGGGGGGPVFSMVRFGNVLGSSGSVIPLFQEQVARGGPVTVTGKDVTRFFMTIEEAVALVLRAGALATGGEVFLLDMGQPVRIGDLARQVIEAMGGTPRDAANPDGEIEIVEIGLRPGEKRHEELLIGGDARPTGHPKIFAAQEDFPSEVEVAALLRDLREAIEDESLPRALQTVSRLVEGYETAGGPLPGLRLSGT
ncbi:polysaccharide biosynthesis protein [Frigidibacter mobilis]|uniref:Nucleotide sugar epimerase/dehydratase n=1 Tax=Frigidibacter mobilis TaxID=1335048 RepID=A0A159Z0V0_9RHOB|nr:nucleoside-diphosphate sugar epimerase/dehydratase [Frigidibacter mobilis]AMY67548.1 nucleotide sugar epimerase/dehydratase [Frigidibacter mobilis]